MSGTQSSTATSSACFPDASAWKVIRARPPWRRGCGSSRRTTHPRRAWRTTRRRSWIWAPRCAFAAARCATPARSRRTASRARPAGGFAAVEDEAESVVATSARFGVAGEGGWRPFTVRLEIADGWHVNANPASQEFLIPTAVEPAGEGELRGVAYPTGERLRFAFAGDELAVYGGAVEIRGEVRPGDDTRLLVTYQACDDERCLPPVVRELAVR